MLVCCVAQRPVQDAVSIACFMQALLQSRALLMCSDGSSSNKCLLICHMFRCNMTGADVSASLTAPSSQPHISPDGPVCNAADDEEACSPNLLIFLPDLNAVLQHRGDAVQRVMTERSVHESTAILLLNAHQGNAAAACRAVFLEPIGKPILQSHVTCKQFKHTHHISIMS